jgi:hypothetical protein
LHLLKHTALHAVSKGVVFSRGVCSGERSDRVSDVTRCATVCSGAVAAPVMSF